MEIALTLMSILLGSGLGYITFLLFWEYMEYDEIDKIGRASCRERV